MPCYDHRDSPSEVREEARKDFRHNSDVAEMLCHVLTHTHPSAIATMPENLRVWWTEHQTRDAQRNG